MDVCRGMFSMVLNMSVTGGIVIVLVMLVRLFLQRVPRKFSYLLWGVVLLRLLCPVSFSSVISVFQVVHVPVTEQGQITYVPQGDVWPEMQVNEKPALTVNDISVKSGNVETSSPDGIEGADYRIWNLGTIAGIVWLSGAAALWSYSLWSVIRLRRQLAGSIRKEKNIYLCDYIHTAFVWGVFRPRIYLPTGLAGTEREYILLHEQAHIRRGDHIVRLLAFWALSIHWFNPLVWCAFYLSERDMEMSCDEAVMEQMGTDLRAAYSESLLKIASGRQIFAGAPLGFGEGNVKPRIRNVMRYRKKAAWIAVPALAAVVFVSVALGSNPSRSNAEEAKQADGRKQETLQREHGLLGVQQPSDLDGAAAGTRHEAGRRDGISGNDSESAAGDLRQPDSMTDSQGSSGVSMGENVPITKPVITRETIYGTEPPELDYIDEKTVIFHGYFGLFVYDREENGFTGAVDLASIGCGMTQGDAYCEVRAAKDGQKVYLHPLNREEMYVYDVPGQTLTITKYDVNGVEMFDGLEFTRECIDAQFVTGACSVSCVWDDAERAYLYLECRDNGFVEDLYLVQWRDGTEKEAVKLFRFYAEDGKYENQQEPEAAAQYSETAAGKTESGSGYYEYYLTEEELTADIEEGYIFRVETTFARTASAQGYEYKAPYVIRGNWPFYVHEENTVNLEIKFSNLMTKFKESIFPAEEQIIVEVISPDGQSAYCFEKTGDDITTDTSLQEQVAVTPGEWTLQVSFAYVCGKEPAHLKIAAVYENPSEQDINWLKEERLRPERVNCYPER